MARRTFFVMFGILLVSCTILFTSRQLIYASSKTERQYNVQLSKWKGNRDQSIESERVRFQQALDDSQAKEAERIRAVGEETTGRYGERSPWKAVGHSVFRTRKLRVILNVFKSISAKQHT